MVPLHLRSSVDDSNGTHHCGEKEPYVEKDGQLVFKPKSSSGVSTSIGIPIISSTSSGLKGKGTFPYKRWTREDCADVFDTE
ncbi:hypothetical protein Tco_0781906 [Tanacetum coccineum]